MSAKIILDSSRKTIIASSVSFVPTLGRFSRSSTIIDFSHERDRAGRSYDLSIGAIPSRFGRHKIEKTVHSGKKKNAPTVYVSTRDINDQM